MLSTISIRIFSSKMFAARRLLVTSPRSLLYRSIESNQGSPSLGIIDLILSEHQYMRDEYERFKSIEDTAALDPRVREWIAYVALHGHKEEIAFYPKIQHYLDDQKKGGYHTIGHGIKEHRELETELKKLSEQSPVNWKQIHKAVKKLSKTLVDRSRETHIVSF